MSIQPVSFMGVKPSNGIIKKASEKVENLKDEAVYYGKEPIEIAKKEIGHRASDLKSYLDSRQQVIEQADASADEIAKAFRAARGIPEPNAVK